MGSHHHQPNVARHGDGVHVEVDQLARLNPGVEPLGHNVEGFVTYYEVELDMRMSGERRSPASVRCTLRLVRRTSATPSRSSSRRRVWLTAEPVTPGRAPAARKPRASATATNAATASRLSDIVKHGLSKCQHLSTRSIM